ncbi:MAG: hypothetical protein NTX56_09780 [Proteobacteria bacterium]|nr:hypothetical protein [Pseudomonadota bacterium]
MGADYATSLTGVPVSASRFSLAATFHPVDKDADADSGGRTNSAKMKDRDLLQAVTQTLSQIGLGQPGQIAVSAPDAIARVQEANTNPNSATDGGAAIGPAFNQFMHSLFQAIGPTAGGAPSSQAGVPPAAPDTPVQGFKAVGSYANPTTRLGQVIQSLSSGSKIADSSLAQATENLSASYQHLATALGSGTAADASGSSTGATSLLTFLQGLEQRLQSADNNTPAGNLIRTSA